MASKFTRNLSLIFLECFEWSNAIQKQQIVLPTSTYNGKLCSKCTGPYKFRVFNCFVCRDNLYALYVNVYLDFLKNTFVYIVFKRNREIKRREKEKRRKKLKIALFHSTCISLDKLKSVPVKISQFLKVYRAKK